MANSPDFGIPWIDSGQAQPDVTHNRALLVMQALLSGALDMGINTPPGSPTIGDVYIIGSAPVAGAWSGRANCVTIWDGAAWRFIPGNTSAGTPITMGTRQEGMRLWVKDEDAYYIWSGSAWTLFSSSVADDSITNAKLANVATSTIKGRVTAGTGDPEDLSASQARTVLGLATTDSPTLTALTLTNGQIVFPATQVASANANTLDDYEEGTWTPVLTFATPGDLSITYSNQAGKYTKIGRFVSVAFLIQTSSFTHSTASGVLTIIGFPFAVGAGLPHNIGSLHYAGVTKASYTSHVGVMIAGTSTMQTLSAGSGVATSQISAADMPSGGTVRLDLGGQYTV